MKIKQKESRFEPIKITIETREEADAFFNLLLSGSPCTKKQWKIMRWAEGLDWSWSQLSGGD